MYNYQGLMEDLGTIKNIRSKVSFEAYDLMGVALSARILEALERIEKLMIEDKQSKIDEKQESLELSKKATTVVENKTTKK